MELKSYNELIDISKEFNLGFNLEPSIEDSLKLSNHFHPWSLRESEARIVYELVKVNNIKYAFEIATAFGISSCVIGQALSKTNGKLVTMDAYVEEHFNYALAYDINTKMINKETDADGYKMAKNLIEKLGISNNVILEIGWSPDDTPTIIERNFGNNKLDFAFIDGGHTIQQIDADVRSIMDYLEEDCVIMFHDHADVGAQTLSFLKEKGFLESKNYQTGFNLWAYVRGNKTLI